MQTKRCGKIYFKYNSTNLINKILTHKIFFQVLSYTRNIFEKTSTHKVCTRNLSSRLEYTFQREVFVRTLRVTAYDERKSRYSVIDCKSLRLATFSGLDDAV